MEEKVWVIDDTDDLFGRSVAHRKAIEKFEVEQKNPALAFSLSIIIWGGGQFYNGRWKEGAMFLLLMVNFIVFPSVGVLCWNDLKPLVEMLPVSTSAVVSAILACYLAGLCVWLFGARRAYVTATQEMSGRFEGVTNTLLPPFCSLLVPGWGQFFNGQGKKGTFFLFVACAGFFVTAAVPGIFLLWQSLEPTVLRRVIEWVLAVCLAFFPVVILLWICGVLDALKVCLDDLKKEPIRKRIACARNRVKFHGWRKTVLRGLMRFALFGFSLALSVSIASHYFPKDFYLREIGRVSNELKAKQMTVIPHFIDKILEREGVGLRGQESLHKSIYASVTYVLPGSGV
jgi:TM2 domain-containing membrane protein YozV